MNLTRTGLAPLLLPAVLLAASCSSEPTSPKHADSAATNDERQDDPQGDAPGGSAPAVALSDDLFADAPLATSKPTLNEVSHPVIPNARAASLKAPLPTNSFWENIIVGTGQNRVNALPYQVRVLPDGLSVSVPNVVTDTVAAVTPVVTDLALGATNTFTRQEIVARDDLSVTVEFSGGGESSMTVPIVAGMAYVTARYVNTVPVLSTQHAITSIDGGGASGSVSGTRFELGMNDGKRWLVYTSAPITLTYSAGTLTSSAPFTGDLRVAVVPSSGNVAALDEHRSSIPLGGSARAKLEGNTALYELEWKTEDDSSPLMYTLPHHQALSTQTAEATNTRVRTVRGEMAAIAAKRWTLRYDAPAFGFTAPRAIDPARRAAIVDALASDAGYNPNAETVSQDPYFGGKQLAKLARLIVIAEELGDTDRALAMRARLTPLVNAWLDGTNGNPLVYDTRWGGIVSNRGVNDVGADFGQGYYNDHHFHYGYHLYAAAVLAKGDASWATQYRDKVLWLVRDIANPASNDPYFPRFRHIDFFGGHSWANGLFDLSDGRNQESTSEAVHAWYAVSLVGQALSDDRLAGIGRTLLAIESAAAQTYWQIPESSKVYDSALASRRVLGNLWSTKADYATFFGANPEYVFGIQMLPYTPATELLLSPEWINDSWGLMQTTINAGASQSWACFLHLAHAVTDKNAAWNAVTALTEWDSGNSRTNSLYWIATRP